MIRDFEGLPAVIAIYDGDIAEFDELKDKIREKYASAISLNPNHQRNVLYISGTEEEFLHEMNLWKAYLK